MVRLSSRLRLQWERDGEYIVTLCFVIIVIIISRPSLRLSPDVRCGYKQSLIIPKNIKCAFSIYRALILVPAKSAIHSTVAAQIERYACGILAVVLVLGAGCSGVGGPEAGPQQQSPNAGIVGRGGQRSSGAEKRHQHFN